MECAARARAARAGAGQGGGSVPGALRGRARPARGRLRAGARARDASTRQPRPRRQRPAGRERGRRHAARRCSSRITAAFGLRCRIEVVETEASLTGTCVGDDLGLLIGRHGQTIDAVQLLARTIVGRGDEERKEVVVDAAGYRDRRRRTLETLALRGADEALRSGLRVELEPMTRGRAQARPRVPEGSRRRQHGERRGRAESLRRRRAALDAWLQAVVATPGLTALDLDAARRVLLEDSLRAVGLVAALRGPDRRCRLGRRRARHSARVRLPGREVVLLEAERRKCDFLERWAPPNARVVWGRAEEQETDWAGVALAKALAPPPVAAEWCLPLVRPAGSAILWVGETADLGRVSRVAADAARRLEAGRRRPATGSLGSCARLAPTPPGFPRRTTASRRKRRWP